MKLKLLAISLLCIIASGFAELPTFEHKQNDNDTPIRESGTFEGKSITHEDTVQSPVEKHNHPVDEQYEEVRTICYEALQKIRETCGPAVNVGIIVATTIEDDKKILYDCLRKGINFVKDNDDNNSRIVAVKGQRFHRDQYISFGKEYQKEYKATTTAYRNNINEIEYIVNTPNALPKFAQQVIAISRR